MEGALLEDYVKFVSSECWYEPFVRWSFLAYASANLARKVYVREGTDYEYPTIYVLFVGPPSAKKSSTAKAPVELFFNYQNSPPHLAPDVMTPAAWFLELNDAKEKEGKLDQQSPMFILSKEVSNILRDIGGGSPLDILLSFFDSRAPGVNFTKRIASMSDPIVLPNPAVTFLGCTTPDGLRYSEVLAAGNTGFISRFITVCMPRFVKGTFRRPALDKNISVEFAAYFDRLAGMRGEMHFTEEAMSLREQIWEECNKKQENPMITQIQEEYWGRKHTQVNKVAMIFACLRHSMQISADDVRKAYDMVTATEQNHAYILPKPVDLKNERLASAFVSCLGRFKDGISEKELREYLTKDEVRPMDTNFEHILNATLISEGVCTELRDGVQYFVKKEKNNGKKT